MLRLPALLLASVLCVSCAHTGEPPTFTGIRAEHGVNPSVVREFAARPAGSTLLGHIVAECRSDDGVRELDEAFLGDVDCSEALLVEELRQKAGAVGADAVVGRSCTGDASSDSELPKTTWFRCSARVAASEGSTSFGLGNAAGPDSAGGVTFKDEEPYARTADAWRVVVTVVPADRGAPLRHARPAEGVRELAVLPPSDVLAGDVIARCRGRCGRDAVRYAVRAGAGRVGARDVVGIACVEGPSGFVCTGHAAVPEVDPDADPRAR
jgi:hypothetical protein